MDSLKTLKEKCRLERSREGDDQDIQNNNVIL